MAMTRSGPGQSGILTWQLHSVLSLWMFCPPFPITDPAILLGTRTLISNLSV